MNRQMDKPTMWQKSDCSICFNNENNRTFTTVNSEEIIKKWDNYVDKSIIINSFEREPLISCCSYCYKSVHELTLLEVQVEKLRKQISELSLLFSRDILERRSRFRKHQSENASESTPPTNKHQHFINLENRDHQTNVMKNFGSKKEVKEDVPKESFSDSEFKMEICEIDTEFWCGTKSHENYTENNLEFNNHEECHIDIKFSYDKINSKVVGNANDIIARRRSQEIPATKDKGKQNATIMPMEDLLKTVTLPVIWLQRLQSCWSTNSANLGAEDTSENIKSIERDISKEENKNSADNIVKLENVLDENQPYKCSICGQGFNTVLDLQNHDKLHYKEHPYVCSFGSKSCLQPSSLKKHARLRTGEKPFNCSFCSKSFNDKDKLRRHGAGVHPKKRPFKCSLCFKLFSQKSALELHESLHKENKLFTCRHCEKSFKFKSHLNRHELAHSEMKPYKCSICEKSFKLSYTLKSHKRSHSEMRPYKCSICEKSFKWLHALTSHERSHSGKKPYKCSVCEKSFRYAQSLKRHKLFHSGEKPYKCNVCEKSFRQAGGLSKHKLIHSSKRQYKCSSCEKSFRKPGQLKEHEKIHINSKERPYQCAHCEKRFRKSNSMKRHEIIHSEEKPYKCSDCSLSFFRSYNLKMHEMTHTGEKPYKCSICEKAFRRKEYFTRHKLKHGENPV